ncbi:MAG: phosphoribosylformylglycinamidine synthase subunit PurQ [Pseudomonadota bacterium]
MKSCVIVFPGSNCDRDLATALTLVTGKAPTMVWHRETALPDVDLIGVPGGFSYGDYLRCGAVAAQSPIMPAVVEAAERGVRVLGICNGFQVLTEIGLLPGILMRNQELSFIGKVIELKAKREGSLFTSSYDEDTQIRLPIAHHDGNYFADDETLDRLEGEGLVAFRYVDNPNGSQRDIAGIVNPERTVLGLMPHPERAVDPALGQTDGRPLFDGLVRALS